MVVYSHLLALLRCDTLNLQKKSSSPKNPIILNYEKENLTVVAIRNISNGNYMDFEEMKVVCEKFGVPLVSPFFTSENENKPNSLRDLLEKVKQEKGIEGCVARFKDGTMFKIKTQWYHDLNRGLHTLTKTKNDNEKYVWSIILDSSYDDMKAFVSQTERERLDRFAKDLIENIRRESEAILKVVELFRSHNAEKDPKLKMKAFMQFLKSQELPHHEMYYIRVIKDIENPNFSAFDVLVDYISKNLKNLTEGIRSLAGGIKFSDYKLEKNREIKSFSEWH